MPQKTPHALKYNEAISASLWKYIRENNVANHARVVVEVLDTFNDRMKARVTESECSSI